MQGKEQAAEPDNKQEEGAQWVQFNLGEEEYAVLATLAQEIVRLTVITPIPNMPRFVKGICNLRGKIVPVLDLKERFEIKGEADPSRMRIIVAELGSQLVGFIVDAVAGVFYIPAASMEAIPASLPKVDVEYIYGVAKLANRLVLLLNLDKMLGNMEKLILDSTQWDKK